MHCVPQVEPSPSKRAAQDTQLTQLLTLASMPSTVVPNSDDGGRITESIIRTSKRSLAIVLCLIRRMHRTERRTKMPTFILTITRSTSDSSWSMLCLIEGEAKGFSN
jgi:hypothetical protein